MKENELKTTSTNGITLIALIITIIVMLILVGVTISVAINGGLFANAKQAKTDTQNEINIEQKLADGKVQIDGKWYNTIEDYLNNKPIQELANLPEGIKVGDYVNYEPDKGIYEVEAGEYGSGYESTQRFETETGENKLQWRILSIDEVSGKIELISATVAQDTNTLALKGVDGYNHGVEILNDLCKILYSKTIDGNKVAIGRSINIEDVDKKTNYVKETYENNLFKYGDIIKLNELGEDCRLIPCLYNYEYGFYVEEEKLENRIGVSERYDEGEYVKNESDGSYKYSYNKASSYIDDIYLYLEEDNISATCTTYTYKPEDYLRDDLGINNAPTGLIMIGKNYWIASRSIFNNNSSIYGNYLVFSLGTTNGSVCGTGGASVFYSYGNVPITNKTIRPVVTIENYSSIEKDPSKTTDEVTYWNINF